MSKARRNEIKRKEKSKTLIITAVIVSAVIILSGIIAATSIHKCDDCSAIIYGKGYYKEIGGQGVLGSVFGSFFGDTESIPIETEEGVIICKECAMNNTSVKAELRNVSEFKR